MYAIKPPAIGVATFMHGYSARLGLGMTRRRIHNRLTIPMRRKRKRANLLLFFA
jgi:hypothetical protein